MDALKMTSSCKRRDFRPQSHNILLEENDKFNLQLNGMHRSFILLKCAYLEGMTKVHEELFQCVHRDLSSSQRDVCHPFLIPLIFISTGLSDRDRENLVDLFVDRHSADLSCNGVCTVCIDSTYLNSAEDIFINATNYIIRCLETESTRRLDSHKTSLGGSTSDSPVSAVQELFGAASKHWHTPCTTGKKLALIIAYGENVASQALSSLVTEIHLYLSTCSDVMIFTNVTVVVLNSSSAPLPQVRKQSMTQMEITRIYRTAPPAIVLEHVMTAILTNMLIPFTFPSSELQRTASLFAGHDQCVWSAVHRLVKLLCEHFSSNSLSLFLMYRDKSYINEWRSGPSWASNAPFDRTARENIVQCIQSYVDDRCLDAKIERLCTVAGVPSEVQYCSSSVKAVVVTKTLDYNLFLHFAGALGSDILQIIRRQFLPNDDRNYIDMNLIWLGHGHIESSEARRCVENLLEVLKQGLQHSSIPQVCRLISLCGNVTTWSQLSAWDLNCPAALENIYGHLERGVRKVRKLQLEHAHLNALLDSLLTSVKEEVHDPNVRLNCMRDIDYSGSLSLISENDWIRYLQESGSTDSATHLRWQADGGGVKLVEITQRLFDEIYLWVEACVLLRFEVSNVSAEETDLLQCLVHISQRRKLTCYDSSGGSFGNFRKRTFEAINNPDLGTTACDLVTYSQHDEQDVSILFSITSTSLESKREVPIAVLFHEFSEHVSRHPSLKKNDDQKNYSHVELAHVQCRFLCALNHLQRVGYMTLAATGSLVRRTLMS